MSSLSERKARKREPLFVRVISWCVSAVCAVHSFLARYIPAGIGWLWRFQGRIPLNHRFAIGALGLALISLAVALFVPNGFMRFNEFEPEAARYLERSGEVVLAGKTEQELALEKAALEKYNAEVAAREAAAKAEIVRKKEEQKLARKNRRKGTAAKAETATAQEELPELVAPEPAPEKPLHVLLQKVFRPFRSAELKTYYVPGITFGGVAAALLALLAACSAYIRKPFALWMLKAAWALNAVVLYLAVRWAFVAPSVLNGADYKKYDNLFRNDIWTQALFSFPLIIIWPALVLVALLTVNAREYYGARTAAKTITSNPLIENLRTGGKDPRFRSSLYWAVFLFLAVIVGPFILSSCGTEEYGLVKGSGETAVQVAVKKIKPKKKPKKKLQVDPWSPYILERMDLDEIKTFEELQEETQDTYVADQKAGKLGKGGKGKGGWPNGMEGAKVRFIRLKYKGGNWDQEMGKNGDYKLLTRFNQLTGLPVANETEAREIDRLAHFAKKKAPPFVFITGSGGISISTSEAKILRDYCENEGGMLFIDNGGGHFGSSVRNMLRKVFPNKSLVDIPNDDPIYQAPFIFPDGAPRFWHHDGNRALGIRHEGRIVVFYHPGDIKDAWKEGHSGVTEEVADQAYKLGVNVIYYAFNQYYRRHYEQDDK